MHTLNPKLFTLTESQFSNIRSKAFHLEQRIRFLEERDAEANAGKIERLVDKKDAIELALVAYNCGTLIESEVRVLINAMGRD